MPDKNSTLPPDGAGFTGEEASHPAYQVGDVIVFKYEGNVRAEVTGHEVIGGREWVAARAADIRFLVPANHIVGVEPEEVA